MNNAEIIQTFNTDAVLLVTNETYDALLNARPVVMAMFLEPVLLNTIEGHIFADKRERFDDNTFVYTSPVFEIIKLSSGLIVRTRNTKYFVRKHNDH